MDWTKLDAIISKIRKKIKPSGKELDFLRRSIVQDQEAILKRRADYPEPTWIKPEYKSVELTKDDVLMLANSPAQIMDAFNALVDYGIDPYPLAKLLRNRTKPIGAPRKTDDIARLDFSMRAYQQENPKALTVKAQIQGVLGKLDSYKQLSKGDRAKRLRKLEVAVSRYRSSHKTTPK